MKRFILSVAATLAVLAASSAADAATLRLISLKCQTPQDSDGNDDCELRITINGRTSKLRHDMVKGRLWTLKKNYPFTASANVQLWEIDNLSADEKLGGVNIHPAKESEEREYTFNREGARYLLKYRVDP